MKQWVKKLVDQFAEHEQQAQEQTQKMTEERATLLYIIDIYNKHLFEIEKQPLRKVRAQLDEFSKLLVDPKTQNFEKTMFEMRQFFHTYRIDEYSYIQNSFDDFKRIIWDFADKLSEELHYEKIQDAEVNSSLEHIREAVEANSINELRTQSKQFIEFYKRHQALKEERREKRMGQIKKNLTSVKKKLLEANETMRVDHLTGAYNRKTFDEQIKNHQHLYSLSKNNISIMVLDIDHFKKINDCYGHNIGDFILKECVRMLKQVFVRPEEFFCRIGGEEFAVILPEYKVEHAVKKAEDILLRCRDEVYVHGNEQIKITLSMGIAQLLDNESSEQWFKRADNALYESKRLGRNRYTIAQHPGLLEKVAG